MIEDDVIRLMGKDPSEYNHCVSCHEDYANGIPMGFVEIDGEVVDVCCYVMTDYEKFSKHNTER